MRGMTQRATREAVAPKSEVDTPSTVCNRYGNGKLDVTQVVKMWNVKKQDTVLVKEEELAKYIKRMLNAIVEEDVSYIDLPVRCIEESIDHPDVTVGRLKN